MRTIFVVGHANRERTKIVVAGQGRTGPGPRPVGSRVAAVRMLKPRAYPRGDFRAAPTGHRDTVH